jgi:hypothetical protein
MSDRIALAMDYSRIISQRDGVIKSQQERIEELETQLSRTSAALSASQNHLDEAREILIQVDNLCKKAYTRNVIAICLLGMAFCLLCAAFMKG